MQLTAKSSSPWFPEAGLRFLGQLKLHNDREWFRERKEEYLQTVEEPMKQLVLAIAAACQSKGIPLRAKERSPVMRVYRDIRFSKNKSPYKTHVAAELRRSFSDSEGLIYLHLSPTESFVAAGTWQPERLLLHAWRETIVHHHDQFDRMQKALKKAGLAFSGHYALSKLPRGFTQYNGEPFAEFLKLTSFVVSKPLTRAQVTASDLKDQVVKFIVSVRPLLEFVWLAEQLFAKNKRRKMREDDLL